MATSRPCAHCGLIFLPEFPRGAARMCSPECVSARRHAQQLARSKRYRSCNKAQCREYDARKTREVLNARMRDWVSRNREHRNARRRERYAKAQETCR